MSWPSINGVNCLAINQWTRERHGQTVVDLMRHGLSGVGFKKLGYSAGDTTFAALVDLTSKAACETQINTWAALRGSKVTIKDNLGTSVTNVMVKRVVALPVEECAVASGGLNSGKYICGAIFTVKETNIT